MNKIQLPQKKQNDENVQKVGDKVNGNVVFFGLEIEHKGVGVQNFIVFIQQKIMNQLDFSPISEKDQQSIDTFSFLHNHHNPHRTKHSQSSLQGTARLCEKLSRMSHNRQSYGFQLLKQFILFSSDEETIEIHYRYTQFQLEQGIDHLQNTYGMHVKLTLVKAFQDIRNLSNKKKAYENIVSINRLASVYDRIMKLNRQQSYRSVFKILAKFIQKQIIMNKSTHLEIKQEKATQQLISNLQKQIQYIQQVQTEQKQIVPPSPPYRPNKESARRIIVQDRAMQIQKLNKFESISQQRQKQYQTNQWRQQVQDIDSYDQAEPIDAIDNPRIIIKSMSNQLHSHRNHKEYLQSTRHKNYGLAIGDNKCKSTQITPARNTQDYDVFQTKRRNESMSMRKPQQQIEVEQYSHNHDGIQNVIVIRSAKQHRRQPDRYIRVPITSEQVKIVELIPDAKQNHRQKYEMDKKLQTISSRHKSNSDKKSQKGQPSSQSSQRRHRKQDIVIETRSANSKKEHQGSSNGQNYRKKGKNSMRKSGHGEEDEQHECMGCKYCHIIREMEEYRVQRAGLAKRICLI